MPNPSVKSAQWSDLAPYLEDWIQSEKLSEIKLHLCRVHTTYYTRNSEFGNLHLQEIGPD